jgi:hypothetical protein
LPVTAIFWPAANVALLVLTMRQCTRWMAQRYGEPIPITVRWVWPLILALPYVSGTIVLGQVNLLVLTLCVLAYTHGWRQRRDMLGGFLVGLAAIVKLYPLIFALFWLAKGRWRGCAAAIVSFFMLAVGLSVAGFGLRPALQAHHQWLNQVQGQAYRTSAEASKHSVSTHHLLYLPMRNQYHRDNNQSLAAVIRRLTTDLGPAERDYVPVHLVNLSVRSAYLLYLGVAGAVFAALMIAARRRAGHSDPFVEYTGWLASSIAFVPIWWTHYFVLVLPALCALVTEAWAARRRGERTWTATMLAGAWLIAIPCFAVDELRLVGVHCWLTIALMAWAITRRANTTPRASRASRSIEPHVGQ